ncbi:MAG: S1 RNA-binding domain-containing protein [Nitrospirae bacterium]|nr:S1 RNA-binding domain-containing protein [Nitrospirota bacterium]
MSDEKVKNGSMNSVDAVEEGLEESFAALLEESFSVSERLEPGQKVKSRVITISGDLVYVDLGGKSEGVIELSEFMNKDGTCHVQEGDEVEAFFRSVEDGMKKLTTLVHGNSLSKLNAIRDAFNAGLPVNGEVKCEVKGGFEISAGGVKCFCPASQIDIRGNRENDGYIGMTLPFKVLEYKSDGRNIVVSRRVLMEDEKQACINRLKETLSVGMDVAVKVRAIRNFGAFVDLGGIDGLIPASEISWARIENPVNALSVGKEVTAKVISLDWDANRLTLSLKAMQPDPWIAAAEKFSVGSKVTGTIVRLVPFGAFVGIEPGIDGLIHISNLGAGRRINHPKEVVSVGQSVEAYVLTVDQQNRKISLSMQPERKTKEVVLPAVGELLGGTVEKIMPFGVFLKLNEDLTGLVPNSEMDTPGGSDHSRMFPVGTSMQAVVLEVDTVRGKVLLSRKAVKDREEMEEFRQYKNSAGKENKSSGGIGSLGELLKARMEEKKITF